jgi:hypothetical protein
MAKNHDFINQCIIDVCNRTTRTDSLESYRKLIEKTYSHEFYNNCGNFVAAFKRLAKENRFSVTSITNLELLGDKIHVTKETIQTIVDAHNNRSRIVNNVYISGISLSILLALILTPIHLWWTIMLGILMFASVFTLLPFWHKLRKSQYKFLAPSVGIAFAVLFYIIVFSSYNGWAFCFLILVIVPFIVIFGMMND